MYRIYSDGYLLHHDNLESLRIFDPSVELELNKTGSFVFTVQPDNPRFPFVKRMKSIIQVWQDDYSLFRGRVLDEEIGWHNEKTFSCEGDLAFLLDSIQRPFTFTGTVAEFVVFVLGNHNAQVEAEKRFQIGSVTVNDVLTVDSTDYVNTLETLRKYLVEAFGGYLITRQDGETVYLDYLSELSLLAPQKIQFGKNLLDLKRIRKGSDIVSAIIPLGATLNDTGQRLTIADVNNGLDYLVDEDTRAEFGFIVKHVIFENITDASELKAAGEAHLAELVNQWESIELTTADMAAVDKQITSFHLGTNVQADSKPHGLNQRMLVTKLSLKLFDPAANKLTLGKTIKGFSEVVVFQKGDPGQPGKPGEPGQPGSPGADGKDGRDGKDAAIHSLTAPSDTSYLWLDISLDPPLLKRYDPEAEVWVIVNDTTDIVYNLEQNLLASIQVAEQNIQSIVAENYHLKEDAEALVSSISTEIEQTKNSVEIQFNQFSADLEDVAAGNDAEFEEIRRYIRFVDGQILLGEVGNELELQIANDRISFLQDGAEVAYFSNRKLYVTDTQILHSLQLGNFAFMPRTNGNLSFKRMN